MTEFVAHSPPGKLGT